MFSVKPVIAAAAVCAAAFIPSSRVFADTVLYNTSPASFPSVTSALNAEFAATTAPTVTETALGFYQVQGAGPVDLTFRFRADGGTFLFTFGYYFNSAALSAIDTSTDAGKRAYATAALAPGNSVVIFDDRTSNPGATATSTVTGGSVLGLFLIPDETLANFQTSPANFAVNGTGSAATGASGPRRFPLFGLSSANPGGFDQLLSFTGTSAVTTNPTNLFAWEDLTRQTIAGNPSPSDSQFNDLIFTVEGVAPAAVGDIPEPATLSLLGVGGIALVGSIRRRRAR